MTEGMDVEAASIENPGPVTDTKPETPSATLWIHGLPDDDDDGELEMRLARFGELHKMDREGAKVIAIFRHVRTAMDAKAKLHGFKFGSGNTIAIEYAEGSLAEIDALTGQVIRGNRDMHWKIGQLVRSTYSAMRSITGNYPPAKQNLLPEDIKYISSLDEELELESKWTPEMSLGEKLADYQAFQDRRPFHNRYVLVEVEVSPETSPKDTVIQFVQNLVEVTHLLHVEEILIPDTTKQYLHLSFKSTRDASILFSALSSGAPPFTVVSVKYAPPLVVTTNTGALWLGCSAFLAVDEDRFRAMMELFGRVVHFKMVPNKNCTFVTFETESDAIKCRNKLFSYELAPGHFLNVDFAPEYEEGANGGKRRSMEYGEFGGNPKRQSTEGIRLEISKMGDRMCAVIAKRMGTNNSSSSSYFLPKEIDITSRTRIDYCQTHLEKLGCTGVVQQMAVGIHTPPDCPVVMWQFAAASERDCSGYDALCDYFVNKERIGFYPSSDGSVVTYFIPPVPSFLEPLGLSTETRYLIAIQMPGANQTA
jgi:RNA recognition motif-containing protein